MNTSIVSYNIRTVYDGRDGINNFIHRAGFVYDKIQAEIPDIIGFQEMKQQHKDMLDRLLAEYVIVGHLRNENYDGEGVYTAIRKDKYQILGFEMRWLSPTPFVPGSRFENQSVCPRTCLMTLVRHLETGKVFRVYNLHLDHISEEARVLGIKSAFEFIDELNSKYKLPYALLGDFNARPDSEVIRICNSRGDIRDVTSHIPVTYHQFGQKEEDVKIDYIYLSDELANNVTDVKIWDDEKNGIYLSDHYPVCANLSI